MRISVVLSCLLMSLFGGALNARSFPLVVDSSTGHLRVERVLSGLEIPWGIAFIAPAEALLTERQGLLWRVRLRAAASGVEASKVPIDGLPTVIARGQGGLLDVQVGPDFASDHWVYLCYSAPTRKGHATRLSRYRLENDRLQDQKILFTASPGLASTHHFGCRIEVDRDGHVYFSVGERGERHMAQMLYTDQGKIHRLNIDGSVPSDNPFIGKGRARASIWSLGHRNPQGLAIHPVTGELWENEHGPRGGDEINRIEKGRNYGWPVITFGREYHGPKIGEGTSKAGLELPQLEWTPSIGPSGFTFVSGDRFPAWNGSALIGSLPLAHLNRVTVDSAKVIEAERLFEGLGWRVRDVEMGPDGLIYLLVDLGWVLRVSPVEG